MTKLNNTTVLTDRDSLVNCESYHMWPDDTWCRSEDLGEYLTFMSDDYITIVEGFDEDIIPTYSSIVGMNK